MNGNDIFLPFAGMLALTFVVWLYMYVLRLRYIIANRIDSQKLRTPQAAAELLPESVNYPASNLRNLCELPVVFYALCLMLYATGEVDAVYVGAAWLFFAFRVLHSLVHCTFNRVILRFGLYMLSALTLWFMLGRAVVGLIT